jgi:hypothetical protein
MNKISRELTIVPNLNRKNKVAVFGEKGIPNLHLRMIADSLVRSLNCDNVVYTVSSDLLGHYVRLACKKYKIATYNRKVREVGIGVDSDIPTLQELVVAGLAWKVEIFYCIYDPEIKTRDSIDSFSRIAMNTHSRMSQFLNCKNIVYNNRIFNEVENEHGN